MFYRSMHGFNAINSVFTHQSVSDNFFILKKAGIHTQLYICVLIFYLFKFLCCIKKLNICVLNFYVLIASVLSFFYQKNSFN